MCTTMGGCCYCVGGRCDGGCCGRFAGRRGGCGCSGGSCCCCGDGGFGEGYKSTASPA